MIHSLRSFIQRLPPTINIQTNCLQQRKCNNTREGRKGRISPLSNKVNFETFLRQPTHTHTKVHPFQSKHFVLPKTGRDESENPKIKQKQINLIGVFQNPKYLDLGQCSVRPSHHLYIPRDVLGDASLYKAISVDKC